MCFLSCHKVSHKHLRTVPCPVGSWRLLAGTRQRARPSGNKNSILERVGLMRRERNLLRRQRRARREAERNEDRFSAAKSCSSDEEGEVSFCDGAEEERKLEQPVASNGCNNGEHSASESAENEDEVMEDEDEVIESEDWVTGDEDGEMEDEDGVNSTQEECEESSLSSIGGFLDLEADESSESADIGTSEEEDSENSEEGAFVKEEAKEKGITKQNEVLDEEEEFECGEESEDSSETGGRSEGTV